VNVKKTEIVVFGQSKKANESWSLNGRNLKVVKGYKYLGLDLYVSLRWGKMRDRLYAKARAKVASAFGMANCTHLLNVDFGVQLWQTLIRPVLEYGAEIWGEEVWGKGEQLQREVAKRILRCPSSTTDEAVLGELGWWTLKARSDMLRLRFWGKIVNMDLSRVTKRVYNESKWLFETELQSILSRPSPVLSGSDKNRKKQWREFMKPVKKARTENWCFTTYDLLMKYGLTEYWSKAFIGPDWDSVVFKAIQQKEQADWFARMCLKPKLRTYRMVKTKLKCEPYLATSDGEKNVYDLCKLRCGTNVLRIETGRYERVRDPSRAVMIKMPVRFRQCLMCLNGSVEDESHCLLHCPFFNTERDECFEQLQQVLDGGKGPDFKLMNDRQRLQLLLMADCFSEAREHVLSNVKKFIGRVYRKRQKYNNCLR